MSWEHLDAGSPLRSYQIHAVEALLEKLASPGARACLMAPPGAGKTRCALHIAAALELPVEVRVPTTALVEQWKQRIRENIVATGAAGETPPIRVSTYAGLGDFEEKALLILDEAHHLVSTWGREILERLTPDHKILGLTATPPYGNRGWDQFLSLVGGEPVRIEVAPLVREGHLCAHQDLVWLVSVEAEEVPELREAERTLEQATDGMREAIDLWMATRLREDLLTLTEARFAQQEGLLVALCRLRNAAGRELPLDLPADPELMDPPTLHDRALVLWDFARAQPPETRRSLEDALREAGFRPSKKGLALSSDVALSSLSSSPARVRGCLELLSEESRLKGDGLRALVLTDRDTEGGPLSGREIYRALVGDRRTDPLDPILVTGSVFWVDDDLWPKVMGLFPALPWVNAGGHHELDVRSWPVAERIALATRLFLEGTIRCLVGTRHLLGEGWDCPVVNCVVDLTGIAAPVTVNQVRGRALRLDPNDPAKVASLWEVVPLAPGIAGGNRLLERFVERHNHTLGIDDRGRVRNGVDRIDPCLTRPVNYLAERASELNARMLRRSADIRKSMELWAIGRSYQDRRVWRLEGQVPTSVRIPRQPVKALPGGAGSLRIRRRRNLVGASALLLLSLCGILIHPLLAAPVLASIVLFLRSRRRGELFVARLEALMGALQEGGQVSGSLQFRKEDVWLEGSEADSRRFGEAAAELLGPVRYPRYLLLEVDGEVWPVPTALGLDRDLAESFAKAWAARVGPCEVIYSRHGRGKELLVEAWRAQRRGDIRLIEEWE